MFEKKNADTLPKHQPYNFTIDLEEEAQPPFRPIYNLSQDELATFHEYIDDNLEKRFIQHSKSQVSALILFFKKKDGSLQMYVNYHGLNPLIIKTRYLLLLIQDYWINLIMPRYTPRSTCVEHISWCAFKKAMNGRWCLEPITTIFNML